MAAEERGLSVEDYRVWLVEERRRAAVRHRRRRAELAISDLRHKFRNCSLPASAPPLTDEHALVVYLTAIAADREDEAGIPRRLGQMSAALTQWPGQDGQ